MRVGGGLPVSTGPLDVLPLLRRVIEAADAASGASIFLESEGDTVGDWDAERVGQVFSNLVDNALRHGTPGIPARVVVDGADTAFLRVDIVNGGAIPHDLAAKLFEPMTGGDGRRRKSQGLGLGLFITKQIVRAHGGTIDVRSSDAGETSAARRASPGRPAGAGAGAMMVLIVDDDDDIRDTLKELFEDEGYEVATTANGSEALEVLAGPVTPSAVVLDLIMPVMTGNGCSRRYVRTRDFPGCRSSFRRRIRPAHRAVCSC